MESNLLTNVNYNLAVTPLIVIKPEDHIDQQTYSNSNSESNYVKSEIINDHHSENEFDNTFAEENTLNRINDKKIDIKQERGEFQIETEDLKAVIKVKSEDYVIMKQCLEVADNKGSSLDIKMECPYNDFNMEQEGNGLKAVKLETEDILETRDGFCLKHTDSDDSLSVKNGCLNEIKHIEMPTVILHSGPNEKPFQCNQCSKSFNHKSSLKRHQFSHVSYDSNEDNPFKCKECGKCFKNPGNLKGHMMVHSGEKPYKCKFCERCFRQSSTLRTHLFTHTGEKPYQCKECGKSFIHNGLLKEHESLHSGQKPFECDICGKCFAHSYILRRHARKHMADATVSFKDNKT